MSTRFLHFIPTDPFYIPPAAAQQEALRLLASFIRSADEKKLSGEIELEVVRDPQSMILADFTGDVHCPHCGFVVTDLWLVATEQLKADDDQTWQITTPCCGFRGSLLDLAYEQPHGLARFVLQARDPVVPYRDRPPHYTNFEPTPEMVAALEQVLGCSLQVVWGHL